MKGISIAGDFLSPSLISRLIIVHSLDSKTSQKNGYLRSVRQDWAKKAV